MNRYIIGLLLGALVFLASSCHKDGRFTLEYQVSISDKMWNRGWEKYLDPPLFGDTIELIAHLQSSRNLYKDERSITEQLVYDGTDWVSKTEGHHGPFPLRVTVLESQKDWQVVIRAIYYRGEDLIIVQGDAFKPSDGDQSVVFFQKPN